jgi:thioredoxin-like negative regulator of GroEL
MVIENTAEPLVIDFYADWCGPCKKLTPILEEKITEAKGKFKLLKVNIDKCG